MFEIGKIKDEIRSNSVIAELGPIHDSNIYVWKCVLCGPPDTPYEQGRFELRVEFSTEYPFKPMQVKFLTKIFHPISRRGYICMDILQKQWSPILTTGKVMLSLSSLLAQPNPDDPMDGESAELYQYHYGEYKRKARLWTQMYAM